MSSKPSKAKRKQMAAKQHAPQAEPKAVTAPEADLAAQAEPKAEAQAQAAPQPEQTQGDKPMKAAPKTQVKLPPLGKIGFFERLQCWCARNYIYILAFFIPVALTYLAYALFGMYPFGPESVLCLDLNGQYVYYFEAIRDAFWGDGSIFYNWSRNLSGEFFGIIGYYLASPFTLIVILLPRTMILGSLLIMQLCKLGTAAVTFCYFLQKSRKLKPLHALLFSMMYAMMAYAITQLIDPMWLDGLVFLPLICLGVEYLIDDGRKINYIIPLALMCFANFYIGFMICIFTALYFAYYLFAGSDKLKHFRMKSKDLKAYGYSILRMFLCTVVALMMAAVLVLPVYNALALGKFNFTANPDYSFKLQFTPIDFFAQIASVAQYNSVNVQGMPEIYCGLITALLLPLFFLNSKIPLRKKIGMGLLAAALFTSMYIRPVDMMWHGGQMPNWLPFRYSFIFSFVILTMAAMAFKELKETKPAAIYGSFFVWFMFLMLVLYEKNKHGEFDYLDTKGAIWVSVGLFGAYTILLFIQQKKNSKKVLPILMMLLIGGELTYNALDTMKSTDKEVAYSERRTYISYIQSGREITDRLYDYDKSFYRADKTYHRTVNDDLAFGLRGITHSSSVMNTRIIKFIEAMGYTCHSYYTKYNGATPISDSLLGIKYVLDQSDNVNESYHEVFSQMCKKQDQKEQLVTVYENPNAMSIGYMVSNTARRITGLGNDNPFNSQNVMMSTICGSTTFDPTTGAITGNTEYFYPIPQEGEPILNNLTARPYGVQTCYDVSGEGDHTIDMKFKALSDDPIYFFFKTENQRQVNLWYSPFWNKEGEFLDGEFLTYYFEGDDYRIVSLGSLPAGQEFTIRMTVTKEYTIFQNAFFYHFNQAKFEEDIAKLKQQQWEITDHSERWFKGTITAQEGQVMMTSIPYEEGWTVKVDGKKVEPIVLFNAMIGVQLSPGTHEVEMSFLPNGFTQGLVLMLLGIAACVGLGLYDHKHNKALLAAVAARQQAQAEYITKRRAKRRTK